MSILSILFRFIFFLFYFILLHFFFFLYLPTAVRQHDDEIFHRDLRVISTPRQFWGFVESTASTEEPHKKNQKGARLPQHVVIGYLGAHLGQLAGGDISYPGVSACHDIVLPAKILAQRFGSTRRAVTHGELRLRQR